MWACVFWRAPCALYSLGVLEGGTATSRGVNLEELRHPEGRSSSSPSSIWSETKEKYKKGHQRWHLQMPSSCWVWELYGLDGVMHMHLLVCGVCMLYLGLLQCRICLHESIQYLRFYISLYFVVLD